VDVGLRTLDGGHLRRLTSLRWFAALAVFADHAVSSGHGSSRWFVLGDAGVSFFFVLSGVVLAWSARPGDTARRFWRRRFARIYPATLVSGVAAGLLIWAGWVYGSLRGFAAVTHLFLIQAWWPSGQNPVYAYNGVAWSLSCEAFFYLLFPLLLVLAARWGVRRFAWLVTGMVAAFHVVRYCLGLSLPVVTHLPILRLPEFALGVAIGVALRGGWRPRLPLWIAALVAGAALLAGVAGMSWPYLVPAAGVLIVAAAGADLRDRRGFLMSPPLVYLGHLSFCFYLTHRLTMLAIHQYMRHDYQMWVWVTASLLVSLAAAAALHHGVELPMQRIILRRRRGTAPIPQPALGAA
jgi:peptidoglycan/LPS O-acetylase OafA/YrhL